MMLSLAIAFLLATILGAEAAPQAQSPQAEGTTTAQMVTVSGECTKLVHAGVPIEGCKNILVNMNYSTGMSAYWFATERSVLSFSGDGSRRVEQGPAIVVQAIETIIRAATTDASKEGDSKEEVAVGFCRFGDPAIKGTTVECLAYTETGRYEGAFVTDGSPPKLETFQINR